MLTLYPEQLHKQLKKKLNSSYLLFGNDAFLLQESQDAICKIAKTYDFKEHHLFQLDYNTDWQIIFSLCQKISLFSKRQILKIFLSEKLFSDRFINKQLAILVSLLHNDLLLIIKGNKFKKTQENTIWLDYLDKKSVLVVCQTPEREDLLIWLSIRAKQYHLQFEDDVYKFLCYYYEGNLMALSQMLEYLSLLCSGKKITCSFIKEAVSDVSIFASYHWVEALLMSKRNRALHILRQVRLKGVEPVILLRAFQRELLLLVHLKRQSSKASLKILFDKYHIWKDRRSIIIQCLNRLNHDQLYQSVQLLTHIETMLKKGFNELVWSDLEDLSILFCLEYVVNFTSD